MTPPHGLPAVPAAADTTDSAPDISIAIKPRTKRGIFGMITGSTFLAMHIGAVVGAVLVAPTVVSLAMCVAFYAMRVFALTAGYHRLFSHRSYQTSRWFQFLIGAMGASSLQRGPLWWCSHHRLHHKHSDQDLDPHSPIKKSVWWAHVGWVTSNEHGDVAWDQIKDWKKYPEILLLEKYDVVPGVLLAAFCTAVDGLSGFVWGFLVSTILVYHVTFLVNSACHLFGYRRFQTEDASRNNWWVALLTFGEGWHNNHHHYPSSTRQGFTWWEVDISYSILRALSVFGIVWGLREPTPRALAKNRVRPAAPAETATAA